MGTQSEQDQKSGNPEYAVVWQAQAEALGDQALNKFELAALYRGFPPKDEERAILLPKTMHDSVKSGHLALDETPVGLAQKELEMRLGSKAPDDLLKVKFSQQATPDTTLATTEFPFGLHNTTKGLKT